MKMDSWSELIKAFETGLINPEKELEPVEYRLHYDDNGRIIFCSMIDHPVDTKYIVVTEEEYKNYWEYEVKNNNLVLIKHPVDGFNLPMEKSIYERSSFPKNAGILKDYE
jgi:hypothetical protein